MNGSFYTLYVSKMSFEFECEVGVRSDIGGVRCEGGGGGGVTRVGNLGWRLLCDRGVRCKRDEV